MAKMRLSLVVFLVIMMAALSVLAAPTAYAKTLYVGGTMALTGAYAEDTAAVLAGYEDYVKYVNQTKRLAPWRNVKFPADITLEVMWRDDELKPPKALTIYEELKAKGLLVFRCAGSPQALALKDRLYADGFGAPSMATGPYLLKPPQSVFTYYPIYTDSAAAVAEWFKENWKEGRKPRFAYLTADSAFGRSVVVPELTAYIKKLGYEFVGNQFVPMVPTSPPTTQLMWLKKKKVDLTFGCMINPGSQPTIKEAVRLGMGPDLEYKITFAAATPSHLQIFVAAMGDLGNGFVVGGGFPPMDEPVPGVKFANELLGKYRTDKRTPNIMYVAGIIEAMTQTEALRLSLKEVPFDKLTPRKVLEDGFYKIKNLNTGGLSSTPLTYGPGDIEGVDKVRVDQIKNGKIVKQGAWPCRHLYKR
jgi:ABC-type branched-subunit amino acid transport system substrate-binding protein